MTADLIYKQQTAEQKTDKQQTNEQQTDEQHGVGSNRLKSS